MDLKVFFVVILKEEFDSADIIDYILEKPVSCPSFFRYDNDKDLYSVFL